MLCPHCSQEIPRKLIRSEVGRELGSRTSEANATASRENRKKGGRPREKGLSDLADLPSEAKTNLPAVH
jgi:hypothetical protein